eukprot:2406549-Amphidinium_carterae.2
MHDAPMASRISIACFIWSMACCLAKECNYGVHVQECWNTSSNYVCVCVGGRGHKKFNWRLGPGVWQPPGTSDHLYPSAPHAWHDEHGVFNLELQQHLRDAVLQHFNLSRQGLSHSL